MNTTRIAIEKKESVRWLENVRQASENLGDVGRCVHIGDRESDIYELFCECELLETRFVLRTCVDRRAGDGEETVAAVMHTQPVKAVHRVEVMDDRGKPSTAVLEIKYHRLQVCPPIGKEKRYTNLTLTVIHAKERGKPKGRDAIEWKLITNLPVASRAQAIEKLNWYALEDRNLLQGPQVGLPGRGLQVAQRRADCQPDRDDVPAGVACPVAVHGQPRVAGAAGAAGLHGHGDLAA